MPPRVSDPGRARSSLRDRKGRRPSLQDAALCAAETPNRAQRREGARQVRKHSGRHGGVFGRLAQTPRKTGGGPPRPRARRLTRHKVVARLTIYLGRWVQMGPAGREPSVPEASASMPCMRLRPCPGGTRAAETGLAECLLRISAARDRPEVRRSRRSVRRRAPGGRARRKPRRPSLPDDFPFAVQHPRLR
jgi:hypothetical protein